MKTVRNFMLAITLIIAAAGLIACGMDNNADEKADVDTTVETVVREITTDREDMTQTDNNATSDDGVVGDIIDDVETDVENIGDNIETKVKDAKDNLETKMKNAKNKTDN